MAEVPYTASGSRLGQCVLRLEDSGERIILWSAIVSDFTNFIQYSQSNIHIYASSGSREAWCAIRR